MADAMAGIDGRITQRGDEAAQAPVHNHADQRPAMTLQSRSADAGQRMVLPTPNETRCRGSSTVHQSFSTAGKMPAIMPQQRLEAMFSDAFDLLDTAIALHDRHGRLVFANESLRNLVTAGDGLTLDPQRGVVPAEAGARRQFQRALAAACAGTALEVVAHRPSGEAPYAVRCQPMPGHDTGVMVTVSDPARPRTPSLTLLRNAFGLTPTEAELAQALANGTAAAAIAAARGVSTHTVRAQIRSLLSKTKLRRQTDLVALMHRMAESGSAGLR
jgi:DNA-binding CsgD family transcriptional regulator